MGFRQELYTKEYFTGVDAQGRELNYGVDGHREWRAGSVKPSLLVAITSAVLRGKDVFEIGYGRGESVRHMILKEGVRSYVGIDFSEAAYNLARETCAQFPPEMCDLHLGDALEFVKQQNYENAFDVVYLLDVIEHIPVPEVNELLPMFNRALRPGGYIMVDTPFYAVDEDFIAQGYQYKQPSVSDRIPQTSGMHCNKFTKERLFREMELNGFVVQGKFTFQKPTTAVQSLYDWCDYQIA